MDSLVETVVDLVSGRRECQVGITRCPESPDSETTDEEAGRFLMKGGNNNSHKKYTDTSRVQTASYKKATLEDQILQ